MGAAASVSEDPSPNELKALSAAIEANFTPGKQLTKAGLTALRQEFATNLATAEERAHDQEIEVTLSIEGAGDLADRDGAGNDSDPFATIDVTYVAERYQTKVINGNLNPTWNETFSFTLGADLIAKAEVRIQVWDSDTFRGDPMRGADFLGQANFSLADVVMIASDHDNEPVTVDLAGRDAKEGSHVVIAAIAPGYSAAAEAALFPMTAGPAAPQSRAPRVVGRKEVRQLTPEAQERFADAIETMMDPMRCPAIDGTVGARGSEAQGKVVSEYVRLAGYHGWPTRYCQHGEETFPGWHRAYLCDFE